MTPNLLNLLFCLLLINSLNAYTKEEWCKAAKAAADIKPTCANPEASHKVCMKGPECEPASNCKILKVTDKEKDYILQLHNEYRNNIALGKEPRMQGSRTASDMMVMSWDVNLELLATCHGGDCYSGHDDCRVEPPGKTVGQNYAYQAGRKINSNEMSEAACKMWFQEISEVSDPNTVYDSFAMDSQGKMIGHYTQMIWAKSERLGCAWVTQSDDAILPSYHLYCNYGPAGNVLGQSIFTTGAAASNCPSGVKKNQKFEGLCGESISSREASNAAYIISSSKLIMLSLFWLLAKSVL